MVEWLDQIPAEERVPVRSRYDWEAIAAELRTRPWKWSVVARDVPRSHAYAIRSGIKKAFRPPADYEVETHGETGNRADLYMRFIGAPKPPEVDE